MTASSKDGPWVGVGVTHPIARTERCSPRHPFGRADRESSPPSTPPRDDDLDDRLADRAGEELTAASHPLLEDRRQAGQANTGPAGSASLRVVHGPRRIHLAHQLPGLVGQVRAHGCPRENRRGRVDRTRGEPAACSPRSASAAYPAAAAGGPTLLGPTSRHVPRERPGQAPGAPPMATCPGTRSGSRDDHDRDQIAAEPHFGGNRTSRRALRRPRHRTRCRRRRISCPRGRRAALRHTPPRCGRARCTARHDRMGRPIGVIEKVGPESACRRMKVSRLPKRYPSGMPADVIGCGETRRRRRSRRRSPEAARSSNVRSKMGRRRRAWVPKASNPRSQPWRPAAMSARPTSSPQLRNQVFTDSTVRWCSRCSRRSPRRLLVVVVHALLAHLKYTI